MSVFENLIHRFEIFFTNTDGSRLDRYKLFEEGFDILINNPFLGVGILGFVELSSFNHHTHSSLLDTAVSFGLIGLLFILFLMIMICFNLIKSLSRSYLSFETVVIFASIFFSFLFFDSLYSNVFKLYFYFFSSLI